MDWLELDRIHTKCISKEMSVKQCNDFISVTWALVRFHERWKHLFPNYKEEHEKLIQLSLDIYKRSHDKEQ